MKPIYFSSALKSSDNKLLEYGQAFISQDKEGAVNFTGDFVPLIRIGEMVSIVRVLGERELERFTGQVYLSSRRLLQIVEVSASVMEPAHLLFDTNANLAADIYRVQPPHFSMPKGEKITGFVRFVSPSVFKIATMEFVDAGEHLALSAAGMSLLLDDVLVQVTQRELLMRNSAILICKILSSTPENNEILAGYFARHQTSIEEK